MTEDETRIEPVIELLTRLAAGDFEARGERSATDDDLDAVMVGINMLAEELGAHRAELEERVASRTVELDAARVEALESSRLKSEFLATMSHEIRTPMNGVIGLTSLLLQTPLDPTQQQYAEGVASAGEALLLVINDILDFSKLEAGMVDLDSADFEPTLVVEGVASLLALEAARKRLELIAYCLPEVPRRLVGDEGRLRQILLNLASNAVKFTDEGEVVITARVVGDAHGEQRLRFQVSDTGIGIANGAEARLFDSFTQADASTTRRFGGTGLGLAISRRLTEAMGGEIGVVSEDGAGSTFWFEVPLARASRNGAPDAEPGPDALRNLRVLVVDDNATNRLVLESQLTAWGMRPDVVQHPASVLETMRAAVASGDPYAVAVLDLCMPDLDGVGLARLISQDASLRRTRLIVLSSATRVDEESLRQAGVRQWLSKPVRSSEFFDRLMRLMSPSAVAPVELAPPLRAASAEGRGRVLIVEDNSLNQLVAEGVVTRLGYEVDIVANGVEAIEAIAACRYSAVLMDCHMPVMDGFTATERIREREGAGERLPIIAMTAGVLAEDRERCLVVGMDSFVPKPVDIATLDDALSAFARPGPEGAVIDVRRLSALRRLGPDDGWGLLPTMTEVFLAECPGSLAAMRSAIGSGDLQALAQAAHGLKGAAATMGAEKVAALCERLESAPSDISASEVVVLLESAVELAGQALRDLLGDLLGDLPGDLPGDQSH